ncbi:hypothetical protein ACF0H5_008332 [Mactra antiquata]
MNRQTAFKVVHHWPTRVICLVCLVLQAMSVNWYLMDNLSFAWAAIYGADFVVFALFSVSFYMAGLNINSEKHTNLPTMAQLYHQPFTYVCWLVYAVVTDVKVVTIFTTFSHDLKEHAFFGPNTLKSSLALSGLVFLSFLPTQHDVRHGNRKDLITSLTAVVIFDVLDGVDFLETLFEKEVRDSFPPDLDDVIIGLFCINMILPSVPLFTLAKTQFGLQKLPEKLELLHKFSIAYVINLPLFITRMVTWHGLSQGISIFLLKNLIAMGLVTFELLEHFFCKPHHNESEHSNHELSDMAVSPVDNNVYNTPRDDESNAPV